jgi:hypothetical protein
MNRLSQSVSAQFPTQASAESLLTRVAAAKTKLPPELSDFLDTIPKQSTQRGMVSSAFFQPERAGMANYLTKISPQEKTLIVSHYEEIKGLLDEKIAHSSKKEILNSALSKVLIEGCALLNKSRNVSEIRDVIDTLDTQRLLKITHAKPSDINQDSTGHIHTQLQQVTLKPNENFSSINITDLKETLKKIFPEDGYAGGAEDRSFASDRRPALPPAIPPAIPSTSPVGGTKRTPTPAMKVDRGATAGGGELVQEHPAALPKPIKLGVLKAWITAEEDINPGAVQGRLINVINCPPIKPADMGGANGTANGDPSSPTLVAKHRAMRGYNSEAAAVSAALVASALEAKWADGRVRF